MTNLELETYFEEYDQLGNKRVGAIGLDIQGEVVAQKMGCDKEKCNCTGSWIEGSEHDVVRWIYRECL